MEEKEAKDFLQSHKIETVIVAGTDQFGALRGKRLPISYFLKSMKSGYRFAWFLLNTGTVDTPVSGIMESGIPDILGTPDLATLRLAPWEAATAFVFLDWSWADGSDCGMCPRTALKVKQSKARSMGYNDIFAIEMEFFILERTAEDIRRGGWKDDIDFFADDKHCYSIYEGAYYEPIIRRLRDYFPDEIEACIPEWGEGQFEVTLRKTDALSMADTAALFKMVAKQIAAEEGHMATFMAKPKEGISGSSGHVHQSLIDIETGRPAFHDTSRPDHMSVVGEHFGAGILRAFRDMTLIVAPWVNSYKRFELDSFAGMAATWGVDNRTVGLRFINETDAACRWEHRVGGADLNPYTAFAVMLGSGLAGIEEKLTLPEGRTGNAYYGDDVEIVPLTLPEAVDLADKSTQLRGQLGDRFVDNLLAIAREELQVFNTTVTDLERRRYLDMA